MGSLASHCHERLTITKWNEDGGKEWRGSERIASNG